MNRVLLVIVAVLIGCLVNMPQLKLKGPMVKASAFAIILYVSYTLLNSQGLVEGFGDATKCWMQKNLMGVGQWTRECDKAATEEAYRSANIACSRCYAGTSGGYADGKRYPPKVLSADAAMQQDCFTKCVEKVTPRMKIDGCDSYDWGPNAVDQDSCVKDYRNVKKYLQGECSKTNKLGTSLEKALKKKCEDFHPI